MKKTALGFTLVELLVVIAIIAILSTIGMVVYGNMNKSARDTKRRSDIHAIALALEQYKNKHAVYPTSCNTVDGDSDAWSSDDCWSNTGFNLTGFIQSMPKDPLNKNVDPCSSSDDCHLYRYCTRDNGKEYFLGVNLENGPGNNEQLPFCSLGGNNRTWIINQQ